MPKDLPLTVAHLLGGTNGFDFARSYTQAEIKVIVERAILVAVEIHRQCEALPQHTWD